MLFKLPSSWLFGLVVWRLGGWIPIYTFYKNQKLKSAEGNQGDRRRLALFCGPRLWLPKAKRTRTARCLASPRLRHGLRSPRFAWQSAHLKLLVCPHSAWATQFSSNCRARPLGLRLDWCLRLSRPGANCALYPKACRSLSVSTWVFCSTRAGRRGVNPPAFSQAASPFRQGVSV